MQNESPTLYVVPTPLGNLGDLSPRAKEVLCRVAAIAAEDTRHSAPLLRHIGCATPLFAAHEHNEEEAAQQIIARLIAGQSIALISDAGTPAISDPGARLVARVREAGWPIVPLPGPCAAITALSASGLREAHFLFYGFLPAKAKAREDALCSVMSLPYALIFYEAPHRIMATVAAIAALFDETRTLVLARELSKIYESIHSATPRAMLAWLEEDSNRQRGEFVLLLSGAPEAVAAHGDSARVLKLLLAEGLPLKQVARLASALTGESKNTLYAQALLLK